MGKFKYLIKRILKMDYKNMFHIAKKISKKIKKNYLLIVADMIKCGIKYQAGYYDYQEFEFYNLNDKQRETYLTRGKNNEIVKRFNDKSKFHIFENKDEFYTLFDKYIKRKWIKLDGKNISDFIDFLKKNKELIVKPVDGEGGKGIEKIKYIDDENANKLYQKLIENEQLIVEECIEQNENLSKLYEKSVNSLRMFTFYKDGESYFLQAVLKIGNGGVVDNFSSGGMYTYVDEEGYVYVEAIDREDNIYYEHPISKTKIVGFKVPMFKEAIELVKEAAKVVPEMQYIGWDVAIGKNEPIIIEGNCFPGVFQVKPSLGKEKKGLIPKYNRVMKIFKEVDDISNQEIIKD